MRHPDLANTYKLMSRIANLKKDPPFIIFQTILDKATLRSLQVRRFFFLIYNGIPEVKNPRGPGEVREGTPPDIEEMAALESKRELFRKRFATGDHCLVATVNKKIVGYEWFTRKPIHLEERYLYRIKVPYDSVYAYDGYILPEHRMCGFWLKFKGLMAEMMGTIGKRRIITMVDYENNFSMSTHLRFGFVPFMDVLVIRVLGKSFFKEKRLAYTYRHRLIRHERVQS